MIARDDIVTSTARRLPYGTELWPRFRHRVAPADRLRSTFRSLGMLIGLASAEFLSDAEQLRNEALEALRRRADALGANAVIGLQFFVSEESDGSCEVIAFGVPYR